MNSLIGSTGTTVFSGTGPSLFSNATIPVYVVWYNNAGHPWSGGQKALVETWINNVGSTPWWGFLRDYSPSGPPIGLTFTASFDDPESEGTTINPVAGGAAQNALINAISGSHLPNNPNGLYMFLPSWTDVTCSSGCAGYNCSSLSTCSIDLGVYYTAVLRPSASQLGSVSPNSDPLFDSEVLFESHETSEALTFAVQSSGAQIADQCIDVAPALFMSHTYLAPNSSPANLHAGSSDYWVQDVWSTEQGGHCINGQTPTIQSDLAPCESNADCTWSLNCVRGYCAIPTCSDGIRNQDESDVDCGSTCGMDFVSTQYVGNCAHGKKCTTNWDCASAVCSAGICN